MYSAYDGLTEKEKAEYCELEIVNSASGIEYYLEEQGLLAGSRSESDKRCKKVLRPLVREHPLTGRRALCFGNKVSVGVVGWSQSKARRFIDALTEYACQLSYQYRHKWQVGDAVLWDNRRVLHAGMPYDTVHTRRLMHRTTWRETEPITLIGSP
jgi:alpha-ketoglutarate-dependent taurine dioxygenase